MKVVWTIKYGEVEKTPKEWGVNSLNCRLRVQAVDDLTFYRPNVRGDADPIFPARSTIQLFRTEGENRVKWFEGRVIDDGVHISARSEGQNYQVVGSWFYLEKHIFKQIWKSYTGDKDNLAEVRLSRVLLGTKVVVNQLERQHMRDQLAEVLEYAKLCGAPIEYDVAAAPDIFLPTDELLDRHCDEAIKRQLYYVPDLVANVDYSVTKPKVWFRKRDAIEPVTLPAIGKVIEELEIFECYDLQRPCVVIRYELENSVDGTVWKEHATAKKPENATGDELDAFMQTINLQGVSRTTAVASLETDEIKPADPEWWKARISWLADDAIEKIDLGEAKRSGELHLPRELKEGSFPDWLVLQGFSYEQETIYTPVKVTFKNGSIRDDVISVDVNATDAETKDYTSISQTDAEPIPVGLEDELFKAVNRREFKGGFKIIEQDCSRKLVAGSTLNLSGSRADYATMRALVNEIEEDIDKGVTTVRFGPPPYLGLDQAVELMRANRTRRQFTFSTTSRATGKLGGDNRIDMPKTVGKRDSQSATTGHRRLVVKTTVSEQTGSIDADAAATVHEGVARPIAPRVMAVCVPNGDGSFTTKKVMGMFSEVF